MRAMSEYPYKALLVDDNPEYARMLLAEMNRAEPGKVDAVHTRTLQAALHLLSRDHFEIVLLDLFLSDSQGYETFSEIYNQVPHLPVVVLATQDDPALAKRLAHAGAQDYLIKNETQPRQVMRAIDFALERHRTTEQMRRLTLIDELTGLLNRRGFFSLGKQHIKIAQRANRQMLLFYIDLDGLKNINDQFGHHEGDRALKNIAVILEETFRSSDLIARLGGDEFTVLAIDAAQESAESMLLRLSDNLLTANLKNPSYQLSLSTGFARFDPNSAPNLENMLIEADNALYRYRRDKNGS
jgi:two-component system, cell cycle response regulator